MSDKKPSNPQVFPITHTVPLLGGGCTTETMAGLTLRDHFAGQVASGILAQGPVPGGSPDSIARTAYLVADALLKERGGVKIQNAAIRHETALAAWLCGGLPRVVHLVTM